MDGNKPRYELHFHGLGQSAVVGDYDNVIQIFQSSLTQPASVHQLPPNILDFTGRQIQLDSLTSLLRQVKPGEGTSSIISAITGQAGVGKSALAIHAAYQLKSDFPEAQLYINLRGTEGQPLDPFEVLAGFLRVWGVDEHLMSDNLTERSNLYRSLLSGKQALVLLDNAYDEIQVRPLLPDSPTCAVLITSRKRLAAIEGASILDLDVMTQAESLAFLQALIGVERTQAELEAAQTILELCTQLPLAIRITGGTLRQQSDWKLDDYANQLTEARQRLAQLRFNDLDVRASLALSYQELDADTARLFRLLGLLTGTSFVPAIAAALLECEPVVAQKSIQDLIDRQLLEPVAQERYRFHDLVRLFARGQLAQDESTEARQATRLRASRWYLEMAEQINLALNPENRRQLAQVLSKGNNQTFNAIAHNLLLGALKWFEVERTNLLASVEWAHQAEVREIVIPLARNLVNFFNAYAYWADWERTHLLALEASRELGDSLHGDSYAWRPSEAEILINLGNVHSLRGNWEKASSCYEQSLGIFGELQDRLGVAKALGNLGNVYSRQSYWEKARECYKQSLTTFRELGDRYGEAQTLANMGILFAQQSDNEKAVVLWQEALTKLPSDLSKTKRVAQWLESLKSLKSLKEPSAEVPVAMEEPAVQPQILYIVGGVVLVVAIVLIVLIGVL